VDAHRPDLAIKSVDGWTVSLWCMASATPDQRLPSHS